MPEYAVEWSGRFVAKVVADNEEEAEEIALDMIRSSPDDYIQFDWSHEETDLIGDADVPEHNDGGGS